MVLLHDGMFNRNIILLHLNLWGGDSAVSIATGNGMDGPDIESRRGRGFSAPVHIGPGGHPAPFTLGTGFFPWVNRPGRGVDHEPT